MEWVATVQAWIQWCPHLPRSTHSPSPMRSPHFPVCFYPLIHPQLTTFHRECHSLLEIWGLSLFFHPFWRLYLLTKPSLVLVWQIHLVSSFFCLPITFPLRSSAFILLFHFNEVRSVSLSWRILLLYSDLLCGFFCFYFITLTHFQTFSFLRLFIIFW